MSKWINCLSITLLLLCLSFVVIAKENLKFYGQCNQDKFLYERFFHDKKDGVYFDIGAHDGLSYSNTRFFEERGWKGVCVEPIPEIFEKLKKNRPGAICVKGCIYTKTGTTTFLRVHANRVDTEMLSGIRDSCDPRHFARIRREIAEEGGSIEQIKVNCYRFNDLVKTHHFSHIDYLSLDVEGAELEILKSIDFDSGITIDVIDVENNYKDPEINNFLISKGYQKLPDSPCPWDEVYVRIKSGLIKQ